MARLITITLTLLIAAETLQPASMLVDVVVARQVALQQTSEVQDRHFFGDRLAAHKILGWLLGPHDPV